MTKTESHMVDKILVANLAGRYAEYPGNTTKQRPMVDKLHRSGAISLADGLGWFIPGVSMPRREPIKHLTGIDGRTYAY